MSRTILITGGSASGKSRWAISYFAACDNVLYLASSPKLDKDTINRIKYSNEHNMVEWEIVSNVQQPIEYIKEHKFFIFDGLASYTSNVMAEMCPNVELLNSKYKKEIEKRIIDDITQMMDKVSELDANMIMITIEPGFSVCPINKEQQYFREILGAVNQRIANTAAEVYLSASGIQFKIK